jgi:hypothetical protein
MNKTLFRILPHFLCVLFLSLPHSTFAQDTPQGILYNLKTTAFPVFHVTADVMDTSGNWITGLGESDFTIIEDGKERPLDGVEIIDPGLEFVAAINPGYSFSILDDKARSRYDKIAAELNAWAQTLPVSGNHAYSLITPGESSAFHVSDPKSWLISLEAYQPDTKNNVPSLDILSKAIDLASTSLLQPGARRAVLFITPMAGMDDLSTLQSLALKAIQLDVRVFVWVVAPADSPLAPGYQALINLADQTGGELFLYSGSEAFPSLTDYLSPLQSSYQLTYTTGLSSSGTHTLVVRVTTVDGQIELGPLEFEMDIQPPNPILVSPPGEIMRQFPEPGNYDTASLVPASQELDLIIEFPDGKPRPLASTSLIVDGQSVATNTSEPFDVFNWDLSGYISTGRHEIQVMVMDVFGLQKTSISIPINVNIPQTPGKLTIFLDLYRQWIILGAAILASLGLVWLWIRMNRRRRARRKAAAVAQKAFKIPAEEKQSLLTRRTKPSPAFLEPVLHMGQLPGRGTLQLPAREIRFGSDPTKSAYVLEDASVESLHAIIRRAGETFTIQDQGSVAGTWVNFEMLKGGQEKNLEHGDLIHFGQLAYRFLIRTPPQRSEPLITLLPPKR